MNKPVDLPGIDTLRRVWGEDKIREKNRPALKTGFAGVMLEWCFSCVAYDLRDSLIRS